jgi:hypothetical protein
MAITEIASLEDAQLRYKKFFACAETKDFDEYYPALVTLLSNKVEFPAALQALSGEIWKAYNDASLVDAQNRYTRAILKVAKERGLQDSANVVLTDAADPTYFGNLIRNGFLWKDSFAPGHGEFAHSYQWLSASMKFNWGPTTGAIYRAVAGVKSKVPMFVKDEGPIRLRTAFLWEWLVDCTEYNEQKFDPQAFAAVKAWCDAQLEKWCANQPTSSWFVSAFFKGEDPEIKPIVASEVFESEIKPRRGQNGLAEQIQSKFDKSIDGFYKDFANDLYKTRNAFSNLFRNANTITTEAKDHRTNQRSTAWFISYYECYRATNLERREHALTPFMVAQQLQAGFGVALDVWAYEAILKEELAKPKYNNQTDFNTVKRAAKETFSKDLSIDDKLVSKGAVEKALGTLQAIDIGKESVKGNYQTGQSRDRGWKPAAANQSAYVKPATGAVQKKQEAVEFHGLKGTINAKVLG